MDSIPSWLYDFLNSVLDLLPDSPFQGFFTTFPGSDFQQILKYINWFVPIGTFATILTAWLSAIIIWYVIAMIMRWVKAIE